MEYISSFVTVLNIYILQHEAVFKQKSKYINLMYEWDGKIAQHK